MGAFVHGVNGLVTPGDGAGGAEPSLANRVDGGEPCLGQEMGRSMLLHSTLNMYTFRNM